MNLPTKIILLIAAVMLGVGLGSSLLVSRMMREALQSELYDQAVIVVRSVSDHITADVINGKVDDVREAIRRTVAGSQSIRYIYVVDFDYRLFAHSFEGGFPRALAVRPHQHSPSAQSPEIAYLKTNTGNVLEIAYPLIEGMSAHIHIGMDEEHTLAQITALRNGIIRLTLLLAIAGIVIGIFVTRRVTRPLAGLAGAMQDFGERREGGELAFRGGGRETADLTRAFNRMISDRKQAGEALRESEEKARVLLNATTEIAMLLTPDGTFVAANESAAKRFGLTPEELVGKCPFDFAQPEVAERRWKIFRELVADKNPARFEDENQGSHYDNSLFPILDGDGNVRLVALFAQNITDRKRAEEEREKLQAQLNQAQKMESVGRLAGGVAHDFNNMLGVILGHTEMALEQVDPAGPLFAGLQEIHKAAERSARLTRQLLAFARKQTIAPKVLDLNETIEGMLKMLRRLIGEDIDLTWLPDAGVWPVKVDLSQIDQILANLCVNARDAIKGVGKATIETGNATFDEAYCTDHPGFLPGEYVLLAVSDDGCGMDKEMLGNLFEPFVTTKEMGTGLGLATVYGIVKQNDGFINVYSEPGHGTTFKVYLPRHTGKAEHLQKEGPAEPIDRGHETILLAEDEPAILNLTTTMLERQGYTVLGASTPGEAIRLAGEHTGKIHLLMTDVVMPEMNGRELAKNLLSLYPDMKRLFMSGYTADVIAHRGVLDEGVNFIQKPFAMQDLTAKVREALDAE